ncbi:MAG: hypothetical protein G01um101449_304 [Parcubacteria group bacterium Gr01-1014_49]|nr:MAG: hypothetical protein G01um101449_304 [Parcubacteria group bacterium Gr01-1014_49]
MEPILVSWRTLSILEALVIIQAMVAYRDGFFWPSQMLERTSKGLPFAMHAGMWGDVFILSPLLAVIVAYRIEEWSWTHIMIAGVLGLAASLGMHEQYKGIPWQEAHVQNGELTFVGKIHVVYMAVAFSILGLYYLAGGYTPYMWWTSLAVVIHVVIGNHMLFGSDPPEYYPGRPLESVGGWQAIGGTAVLTFGSTAFHYFRG